MNAYGTADGYKIFHVVDRPEYVAEAMLAFITEHQGLGALAQLYAGGFVEE